MKRMYIGPSSLIVVSANLLSVARCVPLRFPGSMTFSSATTLSTIDIKPLAPLTNDVRVSVPTIPLSRASVIFIRIASVFRSNHAPS